MPTKAKTKVAKITDLIPDDKNANTGTERGLRLLDDSLEEDGAGRGILLDKNGKIIAGNKTVERLVDQGFEEVIIVETDGKQIVATQRTDVDLDTTQGRRMALRDNRVGQVDLAFDPQVLKELAPTVDLTKLWNDGELNHLLGVGQQLDFQTAMNGMPEFVQDDQTPYRTIHIHFMNEADVAAFATLLGQPISDKTRYLYFPPQKAENLKRFHEKS